MAHHHLRSKKPKAPHKHRAGTTRVLHSYLSRTHVKATDSAPGYTVTVNPDGSVTTQLASKTHLKSGQGRYRHPHYSTHRGPKPRQRIHTLAQELGHLARKREAAAKKSPATHHRKKAATGGTPQPTHHPHRKTHTHVSHPLLGRDGGLFSPPSLRDPGALEFRSTHRSARHG